MKIWKLWAFSGMALLVFAAEKKPATGSAENERVAISATLLDSKEAIKRELGSDLEDSFLALKVALTPKGGQPLAIHRDDFTLKSDKDGQKCGAFAPSQIAGDSALVVSGRNGGGGMMVENPGPVWGGIGGRPSRMGGDSANIGNTSQESAQASFSGPGKKAENPLLILLTKKELPEQTTAEARSGLLYFSLEGKHKAKDLELWYNGPAGKLTLRFR